MSASELLHISERHVNFNDKIVTPRVVTDIKSTSNDVFKTKNRYFKEEAILTATNPTFGSEYTFEIKRSDGFISELWLDFVFGGAATTGDRIAQSAIDYVQIELGKKVLRYSGRSLAQYLDTVNTDKTTKDLLATFAGTATTTTATGQVMTPLIGPGSHGIYQGYGQIGKSPAWPVGKMSNDMIVKIGLRSQAALESTASATLTLTSMKLRYNRFRMRNDEAVPKTAAGRSVIYSYNFVYILDTIKVSAQTDTVDYTFDISNIVTDGDLQWVGFNSVTAANNGNGIYFTSQAIAACKLKIKGSTEIYSQSSILEGRMKHLQNFKSNNVFGTTGTYFQNMPISSNFAWNTINPGCSGANLNLENPALTITAVATATVNVHIFAVLKCVYQLYSDRTASEVLVFN